jgi:hypothetical protein
MTFIISAGTKNIALQVADTRVTSATDGTLIDDSSIKTTVVHGKDAKLILSFTGLASVDGMKTDQWIVAKLNKFKAWERVFQEIMDHLRDEATVAIGRNKNLEKYGLEIVVIGLGFSPKAIRQLAIAVITNRSEPVAQKNQFVIVNSIGRPFFRYILNPEKIRHYVGIDGAIGAPKLAISGLRKTFQSQLRKFREGDNPKKILDQSVAMLRLHRKNPQLAQVIGNHCVAVAIASDFSVVCGSYGQAGLELLVPNFVRSPE